MIRDKNNFIPFEELVLRYDDRFDVLYILVNGSEPSYGDEDYSGIVIKRSLDNDMITGVVIMDYSKRNKEYIKQFIPFNIDFRRIDQNLFKN